MCVHHDLCTHVHSHLHTLPHACIFTVYIARMPFNPTPTNPKLTTHSVCAILPKDALTFLSQDAANNPHAGSAGGGGGTQQRRAQQQYSGQPSGGGASTDMTGDDDDDGQEEG